MIKLIDDFKNYDFSLLENDIFFQRIYADFYGSSMFNDSLFYVSVNNDEVDAVIGKIGPVITLSASEKAPFEELAEFFSVIGFSVILCDERFSSCFNGEKSTGDILKLEDEASCHCKARLLYSENLKDVYYLITKVFDIQIDFVDWFVDMSHKLRHNTARCCGIYENDRLVSAAFSLFETENSAVISAVASDENFRGIGYGERVLKTLISENNNKNIYVFTENKEINNWYKKFGFIEHKRWSEIKNVL